MGILIHIRLLLCSSLTERKKLWESYIIKTYKRMDRLHRKYVGSFNDRCLYGDYKPKQDLRDSFNNIIYENKTDRTY